MTQVKNLGDFGFGNVFLDSTPKARSTKEKSDQLDFIKIKIFCSAKDTVKEMRRQARDWKKIIIKHISGKGLVSKIYKELLNSTIKKKNT